MGEARPKRWLRDLAGGGGGSNGRRDAVEDQQRRGQETAADAEHARKDAGQRAQRDDDEAIDRKVGDREVDVHFPRDLA
jgi:hypothetical protein